MKRKSIVTGALILTTANIITRILGFVYRIYMSNIIGAEGMGLYQLIMPVYMLAWSISSSGFSTTVSKLIAAENVKKNYGNMGRILKQSVVITGGIGAILSVLLFYFADFIALDMLKDSRTIEALKILSLCFPFMAASSSIRGYFFGLQDSTIPAISQVFEQFLRMGTIYLLAQSFIPKGLSHAIVAAVIGICIGEIFSFLLVIIAYYRFKRKNILTSKPSLSTMCVLTTILSMALPLSASRIVGSLLSTVENILIPQRLMLYKTLGSNSMSIYGQLTGMAMPLIQFPSALLVALSITLVPAVSEATAIKNKKKIHTTVSKSLLFTFLIGIGASAVFIVFPKEMGLAIYKQKEIGSMLLKLGIMCPFLYLQMTMSGILNGLGQQKFIFRNNLISSAINILFIFYLIPLSGVNGFILGWFVSLIVTCTLCLLRITKCTQVVIDIKKWLLYPALSVFAAAFIIRLTAYRYLFIYLPPLVGLFTAIFSMLGLYLLFLVITECLTINDLKKITNFKT